MRRTAPIMAGPEDAEIPAARSLWIFGDNILECERGLELLAEAVDADDTVWDPSPLFAPHYRVTRGREVALAVQLFPGYGRWAYDIRRHMKQLGAPLREATDAIVIDADTQDLLLALEFCGALPAGNNAWQRCGRGLACAAAEVPYLYYAELGGIELDESRQPKAPRFPNPLVPFAYLSLSQLSRSLAAPVFVPSPTISAELAAEFADSFGEDEALAVIRDVLRGAYREAGEAVRALERKAEKAVEALADRRRRVDTLVGDEWAELAACASGRARADWLVQRALPWRKRTSIATPSLGLLLDAAAASGVVAAGATDIPVCLLPTEERSKFAGSVKQLYGDRIDEPFLRWLAGDADRPLVIVWIAGFKPRGDDSRPDRGLLPLAQMLLANGGDYLTVLYGPATRETWKQFERDMTVLARTNGLWETIVGLSDAILVDSPTADLGSVGRLTPPVALEPGPEEEPFDGTRAPAYGEHDVDTILHTLFASAPERGIFEAMCNPPGGDWSGISFQAAQDGEIARWSSLPRVTKPGSKRPDHVIVFYGSPPTVLAIESKDTARSVDHDIGARLTAYVDGLFQSPPTILRLSPSAPWAPFEALWSYDAAAVSAAAFRYQSEQGMRTVVTHADVDLVFGVEFHLDGRCTLHVHDCTGQTALLRSIGQLARRFGGWLEVQEH